MPRKLRLEFPGACYHVINRGNYRADVFASAGAKAAFEACLFEACARSDWLLYAYTVMRNHYHLALETPAGNLAAGMQWLQATFANRFNRFRDERGHLFQGRYKALLVEEGDPLASVCSYIHLNPVRAGITTVERLAGYRYSSYWYLRRLELRPAALRLDLVLAGAGRWPDCPAGWNKYQRFLINEAESRTTADSVSLSRGWALGSPEFKATLIRDHAVAASSRAWEKTGAQEIRGQIWEQLLVTALRRLGRTARDLAAEPKASRWKVALASFLKSRSEASNPWLAKRLRLGSPKYVSYLLSKMRKEPCPPPELVLLKAIPNPLYRE